MAAEQTGKESTDATILRVANMLKEASNLLTSETNGTRRREDPEKEKSVSQVGLTQTTTLQGPRPSPGMLGATLNRARQMLNRSASSGMYRRLNQQERLRATKTETTTSKPKPKKPDKAIEFALIRGFEIEDDDCDKDDQTLKWDSVIADGIIMVNEGNSEAEIRLKVKNALNNKFPVFGADDFEFIKVRQKRISKPELQPGAEYNFMVIKKMAGQGMLYLRMKPGYNFALNDDTDPEEDEIMVVEKEMLATKSEESDKHFVNEHVPGNTLPPAGVDIAPIMNEISEKSFTDPVEILRYFQSRVVRGRQLNLLDASEELEGETNLISVGRDRVIETTFAEFKYITNFCITFEVDFMGEVAKDMGGPRLEWITLMNKAMQKKYFEKGLRSQMSDDYYWVGVMCGITILQNGQMPRIFPVEVLDMLFSCSADQTTCLCINQLQKGLQVFGLQELFFQFPFMRHLLQPSSHALTVKNLMCLMQPQFSPEGSTAFSREKEVYSIFVKYIREVASGRRQQVTLPDILSFVTGCSEEPVLGFAMKPTIEFVVSAESNVGTLDVTGNVEVI